MRLKNGNTPKHEAIAIVMQLINQELQSDLEVLVGQELTRAEYKGIYNEMARIHNRLAARFDGDASEIELLNRTNP